MSALTLACPFCGEMFCELIHDASIFAGEGSATDGFKIRCEKCGCQTCWWHSRAEVLAAWNTRCTVLTLAEQAAAPKIVTSFVHPPIPIRHHDWCAFYDGEEERGHYGYGATEAEAILDLQENWPDDADALGYAAFLAGELPSDNPYPYGANQWQAWIMGFSEAQADEAAR